MIGSASSIAMYVKVILNPENVEKYCGVNLQRDYSLTIILADGSVALKMQGLLRGQVPFWPSKQFPSEITESVLSS